MKRTNESILLVQAPNIATQNFKNSYVPPALAIRKQFDTTLNPAPAVEQVNRTIVEPVKCILFYSKVAKAYWTGSIFASSLCNKLFYQRLR